MSAHQTLVPDIGFADRFRALTEHAPFPWQEALFERLVSGDVPSRCDIPTGLGKTSVLALWLLALARRVELGTARGFPRRLVYVVNRRTVVDQATREAESLCGDEKVADPRLATFWTSLRCLRIQDTRELEHLDNALAISTLRGQFADNGAWRADPARPAIVIGTVDMIGSRLLFSGYGRGFKTRPLHAGFLGQGALLVHDEAHLEPAFQELLLAIELEHARGAPSARDGFGRLQVMALTATSRDEEASGESGGSRGTFQLTEADREHPKVLERIRAKKRIELHPVDDKKLKVLDRVAELALEHRDGGGAILVFLRRVDDVQRLKKKLPAGSFTLLTGTIRGLERDRLKQDPIFARFDPKPSVAPNAVRQGTVYLVCTSAGEVGVDISADHLVCDLTPFDSMAQRFGRVNRFGLGDARIDIVHATDDADAAKDGEPFERARARTLAVLAKLPPIDGGHDASPAALAELPADERRAAFTPAPEILPVTEVLFDAWALTSILDALPGRPPVADWLHGVAEWEPPETHVAWRDEVERDRVPSSFAPRELLEVYPLKPHELLRDTTKRVLIGLKEIAARAPNEPLWIVDADGRVDERTLAELVSKADERALAHATVVLPPSVGGLDETGALDGEKAARDGDAKYDVADNWRDEHDERRRVRFVVGPEGETEEQKKWHAGMRLVLSIPLAAGDDDDGEPAAWRWYVEPTSADSQGSRSATKAQTLLFHLESAEHFAREIVDALGLDEPEAEAVIWAARFHDLGKERRLWQRSIGNFYLEKTLAKSDGKHVRRSLTKYRHELGSLFDVEHESEFARLDDGQKELARHLIAAHHGRARPCFPKDEVFDPSHSDAACLALAREVPRRFARLQRKYGRWGLAYLESLLRAADVLASLALESKSDGARAEEVAAE